MRRHTIGLAVILFLAALASGCKQDPTTVAPLTPQGQAAPLASPGASPTLIPMPELPLHPSGLIEFVDVTAEAGIHFRHRGEYFRGRGGILYAAPPQSGETT